MLIDKEQPVYWVFEGHSIRDLIKKLESYEDPNIEVRLSTGHYDEHKPISLVGRGFVTKSGKSQIEKNEDLSSLLHYCQLINAECDDDEPEWVTRGKNIGLLIRELKTFEDQNLKVRIHFDSTETHKAYQSVKEYYVLDGTISFLVLV